MNKKQLNRLDIIMLTALIVMCLGLLGGIIYGSFGNNEKVLMAFMIAAGAGFLTICHIIATNQ